MAARRSKIVLTLLSCLFFATVVFNNTVDSNSNYQFVRHVLSMDTTFHGNAGMGRALTSPVLHKVFYASIILWEGVNALLLGLGGWRLFRARRAPAPEWQQAKGLAIAGLTSGLALWYLAFITVGGEWFLMWQSHIWNGQEAAARMFTLMGLSLIFLTLKDE